MKTFLAPPNRQTEIEMLAAIVPMTQTATLDVGDPKVADMLRRLDVNAFTTFLIEELGDRPVSRHATLAMMHKIRAQWRFRRMFSEGAMRVSKRWLKEHGFTSSLYDKKMEEVQNAQPRR